MEKDCCTQNGEDCQTPPLVNHDQDCQNNQIAKEQFDIDDIKSLWVYFKFENEYQWRAMDEQICKAVGAKSKGGDVDFKTNEADISFSFDTKKRAEAAAKRAAAIAGVTRIELV
jgi:hypothetical protein